MADEVRIPSGELLVVLVVHHENIVRPFQVVGSDLSGDVPGEVIAALRSDPRHGRVGVPADVPIVRATRSHIQVNHGVARSQDTKHSLGGR
jgi:hypothetical protein